MDVGVALPTMARGYTRATTVDWCRLIDEGPFSSVSCGERITFHNQEAMVTNAAAAALTSRVRVLVNLVVLPMHPAALVAKQVATLDVLSGGRVSLAVGIGGREHDHRALGASMRRRHERLDEQVAELRRTWAGVPPFDGADPIGPEPVQPGGPELLAGALGPKAMARAARWADGISGASITGDARDMARAVGAAHQAWDDAGRSDPPRVLTSVFYALGDGAAATLRSFAHEYLAIFGEGFAGPMADAMEVSSEAALHRVVEGASDAGVDELVLVPATTDVACLERTITCLR